MEAVFLFVAFVAIFALAYWYTEVYTPRKHMREAMLETEAAMRWQQRGGPGQPTCHGCYGEQDPRCCNFGRRLLRQVPPRQSPAVPPPMADTLGYPGTVRCDEHYYDGCPNCGRRQKRPAP